MGRVRRVFAIIVLVFFSVLTAVVAGAGLAIWDMNETVSSVYGYAIGDKLTPEIGQTTTVVTNKSEVTDIKNMSVESYSESKEKHEPNVAIPEQFINSETGENGNENELNNDEAKDLKEPEDEDSSDEESEEEPKKVIITSEIAGIKELVKAGTNENLITEEVPINPLSEVVIASSAANNVEGSDSNIDNTYSEKVYDDPNKGFPKNFTDVDISYFDDALFIGDSRMQGLGMNSGTNATFYAATAFQLFKYMTFKVVQTPEGKVPIFEAMPYDKFTKIYIKVGLNELGCISNEKFLDYYLEFITRLREMQPRAIIYVHAVLPVTASKSASNSTHTNEKIKARNESLKMFAEVNNCYYIDASAPFVDETGALRAETTADGVHMSGKYMREWTEYLRTHAVLTQ